MTFRVLFREFVDQFFISESATSDMRLRQVMIAVLAFLMTPGLMLSVMSLPMFDYAFQRAPQLVDTLTKLFITIFVSYSFVAVGLIAAGLWVSLTFDRRDAMVLGPLPMSASVVIRAKLAAMAAVLVGVSLSINVVTAVPFSLVSSHTLLGTVPAFGAQLVTTTCAAFLVFSIVVTVRALLGMVVRGHLAAIAGSFLQFVFVAALLCFVVLAPHAAQISPRGRGRGFAVFIASVPQWLPTNRYVDLYLQLRGIIPFDRHSMDIIVITGIAVGIAVLTTIAGYRRQLQLALAPSASTGAVGGAVISRSIARVLLGRNRLARAVSDFILTTIVRNSQQQSPIAFNMALGLGMVAGGLVVTPGGLQAAMNDPTTPLRIPLMMAFWTCVGLRASFFVPSELPASWMFHTNAPTTTSAYALGTRAAIVAFVSPPAAIVAFLLASLVNDRTAAFRHACLVLLAVVALANLMVLTINKIPFTEPYEPGHAKLKSRWPLYAFGAYFFSAGISRLELQVLHDARAFGHLLLAVAILLALEEWAIRGTGRRWSPEASDAEDDFETVITLGLNYVEHPA